MYWDMDFKTRICKYYESSFCTSCLKFATFVATMDHDRQVSGGSENLEWQCANCAHKKVAPLYET